MMHRSCRMRRMGRPGKRGKPPLRPASLEKGAGRAREGTSYLMGRQRCRPEDTGSPFFDGETGLAGEHGSCEKDLSRGEAHNYSMEVRSDPFESAKSHFFDTSSWGEFCDVTLTLKQAWQPDRGGWVKIDDYRCRQVFRHFMNLLNRAVYGSAFRRHGKRLRVLPYLKKARSAPARYVHGSAARQVDGIFIVQLNCPH